MPKPPSVLSISQADRRQLEQIAESKSAPPSLARRARILLLKSRGMSNGEIASELDVNINTVSLWVSRYRNRDADCDLIKLLSVAEGRGRKREIDDEAIAWLKSMNEQREADGEDSVSFTRRINAEAEKAGHSRMSTVSRTTVNRILDK